VNTTPHGRGQRLRKPALAAISAAALGATAVAPASADAQAPPPTIKLKASKNVLSGNKLKVRGLLAGPGGQRVHVERKRRAGWKRVGSAVTRKDGRFRTSFRAGKLGRMKVRVVGPEGALSETRRATVYKRTFASYYGPGFYGRTTACGRTLTPSTIGVAHKSLPCGTRVRFHHRGRTVNARVIDRGPYAAGRTYDLTEATKHKLGFGSTGTVWSTKG
jgi:rare lipoprotein A (peptidoglycan hydrolase)